MQKNEGLLLKEWIEYYTQIVDPDKITIVDTFSDDPLTLEVLSLARLLGINVILGVDFKLKGSHWIQHCKSIGVRGVYIPLDADEFLTVVDSPEVDIGKTRQQLLRIARDGFSWSETIVIRHVKCFVNKIGASDEFVDRRSSEPNFEKSIYVGNPEDMTHVDFGYHQTHTKNNKQLFMTDNSLARVEFHNRQFDELRKKAIQMLLTRLPDPSKIDDEEFLRTYKSFSSHRVKELLIKDAEDYRKQVDSAPTALIQKGFSRMRAAVGFEETDD